MSRERTTVVTRSGHDARRLDSRIVVVWQSPVEGRERVRTAERRVLGVDFRQTATGRLVAKELVCSARSRSASRTADIARERSSRLTHLLEGHASGCRGSQCQHSSPRAARISLGSLSGYVKNTSKKLSTQKPACIGYIFHPRTSWLIGVISPTT